MQAAVRTLFLDHVGVLGGAEIGLVDHAADIGDMGHTVLFEDGPLRHRLEAAGLSVTVLPAPPAVKTVRRSHGPLRSIRAIPHVVGLARAVAKAAKPFDVIWANSQKSFVVGCLAAAMARRPLVWHLHDILTADHFSGTNRRLTIGLANLFARRVVTVSEATRRSFVDAGGRADLAVVVYNGINPAPFARSVFEISPTYTVGLFGRLTPWKGQDVLIRALATLPGVHARIVGDALFDEGGYPESLRKLAVENGVADRCHFVGFQADIPAEMSRCDVIVHTSTSPEPFGRVIVEGMLSARPVIAVDAGGAAEIVTDGVDGLLVPPGDPVALAAAISRLQDQPAFAARLAAAGKSTALERFGLSAFTTACESVRRQVAREQAMPRFTAVAGTGV